MAPRLARPNAPASLLVILVAAASVLSCGPRSPVVVGGLVPETGSASVYGKQIRMGMDLAVDEINKARDLPEGRELKIEYRDDGSSGDRAKAAVRELIQKDRVAAIIGGVTSAVALDVMPLIRDKEVVLLSPTASSAQLSSVGGGWFFRDYPSDMAEGQAMGVVAISLELNKMAVLAYKDPFGEGIADIFIAQFEQEKSRKVIFREEFLSPLSADAAKELTKKVMASGAEGVFLAGYIGDVSTVLQALQNAGYKGARLTTSAVNADIVELAGVAAEHLVFPQVAQDVQNAGPQLRGFNEAFKKKYGRDPESFAAYGYDAVKVLAEAIRHTRLPAPGEIRLALANVKYAGVTGPIAFDGRGDIRRDPHLNVVYKGEVMHFEGVDPAIRGMVLP